MNKATSLNQLYQHYLPRFFALLIGLFTVITMTTFIASQHRPSSMPTAINEQFSPTIQAINAYNAFSGKQVTIVAKIDNSGQSKLNYHWRQTKGPKVNYQSLGDKITFLAPTVSNDTSIAFSLTVSTKVSVQTQSNAHFIIKASDQTADPQLLMIAILLASMLAFALEISARRKRASHNIE